LIRDALAVVVFYIEFNKSASACSGAIQFITGLSLTIHHTKNGLENEKQPHHAGKYSLLLLFLHIFRQNYLLMKKMDF